MRAFCTAIFAVSLMACASAAPRGSIDGYAVRAMDSAPVEIDRYPTAVYRGRYAYLVGGEWWWPSDDGWVVFRDEPLELSRARLHPENGLRGPEQTPFARGGGPPAIEGPPQDAPPIGVDSPSTLPAR